MNNSIVYLVGAGPGDYKLITLRGLELIKKADCIVYDYLANAHLLKFTKDNCKLIYVGKKSGAHSLSQDKINQLLVHQAKIYKNIVRLKGGDPFIFGRGAEEALFLKEKRIKFEIVPGVTSAISVPAYAGIPLTLRHKNSTVGFITGHEDPTKEISSIDWPAISRGLGTIVFLMGISNLKSIVEKLIISGKPKNTPVAIIREGTTAKQYTLVGKLSNIAGLARKNKISAPAIIVVGEVVHLRKELNWFEKKPLFGKKIIVTRSRGQASMLSEKLIEQGAEVIEIPTIKIAALGADKKLKQAFFDKDKYDWVFFTSQNGVKIFLDFLAKIKKDSRIFKNTKICAIGTETNKALSIIGINADYIPADFCAESIVEHFNNKNFKGKKALILRAKQARDVLPNGLEKAGLTVKVIDLYDTLLEKESIAKIKQALAEKIDAITFTSSSTVTNFIKLTGRDYRRKLFGIRNYSIGPITSRTLRKFKLKVSAQAKVYTIEGLAEAIIKND